jgi:hypothetical protein
MSNCCCKVTHVNLVGKLFDSNLSFFHDVVVYERLANSITYLILLKYIGLDTSVVI